MNCGLKNKRKNGKTSNESSQQRYEESTSKSKSNPMAHYAYNTMNHPQSPSYQKLYGHPKSTIVN